MPTFPKFAVLSNVLAVCLMLLAVPPARAEIIDRILAVVGGELIMLSDVIAAVRLGLVDASASPGDPIKGPLDALIERQLTLIEVNRYFPPEPSGEAIDRELAAMRARLGSAAEFDRVLSQSGLNLEQLRSRLRDDLRIAAYIDQRFGATLQPTDDMVARYYRMHEADFTRNGVLQPFEVVREAVRSRLVQERRGTLIRDWVQGLRRRADVTELYLPGR